MVRHRKFLKQLEAQKNMEREEQIEAANEAHRKKQNFRDQAAKQRSKIKTMKEVEVMQQNEDAGFTASEEAPMSVASSKPDKLTEANLKAHSVASSKKTGGAKSKASAKPAWARTEAQVEEDKEAEIDSLLEFAYELDYEKYMEDYEVR